MKVLASTVDMPREEWLRYRQRGLGGSDAPVVMGVNPWRSLMDLWLEKTGQFSEDIDNEAMYWGRKLEEVVAQEFAVRTGKKVQRRNAVLQHDEYPFMLANVDRLVVGESAGLECKTTSAFYNDDGTCPDHYYAQVQHYMAVTGRDLWYVAVLAGGQRFYLYKVPRSDDYIAEMIHLEYDFWKLVEDGAPPELDGSEASGKAVSCLYPEAKEGEIILPADAFALVQQYDQAAEAEKAAKLEKDEAANRLKAMLGDAERGSVYDRKVNWSNVTQSRFDSKRFQKEHEKLYQDYCRESTFRRFSIK